MIHATVMLDDETRLAEVWLRTAPRVGEFLWFSGATRDQVQEKCGAGSVVVEGVAHWVCGEWAPTTHVGEPIHSLAVFVSGVI